VPAPRRAARRTHVRQGLDIVPGIIAGEIDLAASALDAPSPDAPRVRPSSWSPDLQRRRAHRRPEGRGHF
jgi:hypothetical protein